MPDTNIDSHCRELNRTNQRGGRMLSIFDLLDAGSLGLDLAAFLMARIARGDSFMVGALPGGAGKTTVMCALLNLVPEDVPLVAATAQEVSQAHTQPDSTRRCYVCHEIGAGHYFAYLWGAPLRSYAALGPAGHILATNLHADDLAAAQAQVCGENGVPTAHFRRFNLMVFLRVVDGFPQVRRHIEAVHFSTGADAHVLAYKRKQELDLPADAVDYAWLAQCRRFIEETNRSLRRSIEETRARVLAFYRESGCPGNTPPR